MLTIKKCKASKYIENLNEINSFLQAKKKITTITNTERLINLIKLYFETVLYYQDHSNKKCTVQIKGKLYTTEINAFDKDGNPIVLDILDISEQFITNIIIEIKKTMNIELFEELLVLLNAILLNTQIPTPQRLLIINSENTSFPNEWDKLIRLLPEELAINSLKIRKNLILKVLREPLEYQKEEYLDEFITSLNKAYIFYTRFSIKVQISNNHIIDIFKTIQDELNVLEILKDIKNADIKLIVNFLLGELITNNNLFQFETKNEIIDVIEKYKDHIDEEQSLTLKEFVTFNPENITLKDASLALSEPNFKNQDTNSLKTIISFVVPYKIDDKFISHDIKNDIDITVEFLRVDNLFEDPIYSFLDSSGLNINGMPLTFLSDSIGNIGNSTTINLIISNFFHPDFEILGDRIIKNDFEVEDAKHGGKYYPYKDFIIDIMFDLFKNKLLPFPLEKKDINSNFISNHLVSYTNKNSELIHHKLFTITNLDSYFQIKKRFLTKMNELYFEDDFLQIRDLLYNVEIINNRVFLDFCYKLLELTIKKSIELSSLYKALWTSDKDGNNVPKSEPDAQAVLYNQIKDIAEIKGIRVSREIVAADGSLDFHFHYTKNDISMNICVELKNAHHTSLKHGIKSQLPLYIKDVGIKEGIFLVLWYKSDLFNKPTKYRSIKELENDLIKEVPKKLKIKPLIIDCSPKISPSKKGSENRLT
ncbi:MAG: hypothetical protein GQ531_11355 [Sulfurovum sp.]|nr:hypothetical protein [Sulfurovum sp.]